MKKLRCVLEATERSARYPRVKLTTGSKRHRSTTSAQAGTRDSHPHEGDPARGHGSYSTNAKVLYHWGDITRARR